MIHSSVRSAGLAIFLTMSGCGGLVSSDTGTRAPGLNVAEAALQGGAGQIALQVSEGALRDSPNDVRALAIKGDALTLLGDYANAETIFQSLLAKDANSVRANIGLGRIKLGKDPAAAEALFQLVLRRDPKDLTALNNLGIARDLQGRHAEAQPTYRQALAINAELESAQVNLALSMAMSGQGEAAVQMLKPKASQPGAATKVKHDYAVVLAMAGHRAEAERVLSENLSPDEVRQVLDSVTGTRTRVARDTPPERAAPRLRDEVEPDVVQLPEPPTSRMVRAPSPPTAMVATPMPPSHVVASPVPPMVVRPRPDSESDVPSVQPVNPIAAAVTNQRSLSLPMRSAERGPETVPDQTPGAPKAIVMPAPPATVRRAVIAPSEAVPVTTTTLVAMAHPVAAPPRQMDRPIPEARHEDGLVPAVQFAAAGSEAAAYAFWDGLVRRFPGLLAQRELTVTRIERGGSVFWRVRTEGFGSMTDASSLCARMHAGGQECFVPRS